MADTNGFLINAAAGKKLSLGCNVQIPLHQCFANE